jgi:hypothetical protein
MYWTGIFVYATLIIRAYAPSALATPILNNSTMCTSNSSAIGAGDSSNRPKAAGDTSNYNTAQVTGESSSSDGSNSATHK